ncbi:MAG: GntR family transcriptional regulator [Actinomycetota bacterium]|nr:GntR family transcriptional regulator [Actinomycetota bacterium]
MPHDPAIPRREVLSRRMLADSAYELVRRRIMDLTIPPESRINIDHLARELDVSNTPLREALARLESEGLVERQNLRGYRTTSLLTARALNELYDLRLLLEPEAARLARLHADLRALEAKLRQTLQEMQEMLDHAGGDDRYALYRAFIEADAAFHTAITEASGNRLLQATFSGLNAHVHLYRLLIRSRIAPWAVSEHLLVLDGLLSPDPEAAAAGMRGHLERARGRLANLVRNEKAQE